MPTTYAHWRFGRDCIKSLPKQLQKIVNANKKIYNFGTHGPDIFFYDLINKDVSRYGYELHNTPVRVFFENAKSVYQSHEEKDKMLAYILGFLTHFTLDSVCHSYVYRKVEVSGVSHNKVEAQWDGHNMVQDNRKINLVDRSESLKYNKEDAKVISYFYPFNTKTIHNAMRAQHHVLNKLNCISDTKRNFLKWLLIKLKQNNYCDLIVDTYETEDCKDSNLRLDKLRSKALVMYPKLVTSLMDYFAKGIKLPKYFEHDLEQWPDYKEIPILSYEKELKYKVKL